MLISLSTDFYTLKFLCYLHLYLFHYVLILAHWRFYITYTYTYFIMYWVLHIDFFILLTFIIISSCIVLYILTFLYYLHLCLFHCVLIFPYWNFCVTYTYTYFIMHWLLHIDIFTLLTFILISSCIDFYTLTFLYYLHLYLFHHVSIFTHLHF